MQLLHYKPRGTYYKVICSGVNIKKTDGSWEKGCVYSDFSGNVYARAYSQFDKTKWLVEGDGDTGDVFTSKKVHL